MKKEALYSKMESIFKGKNIDVYEIGLTKNIDQRRRNYQNLPNPPWTDVKSIENNLTADQAEFNLTEYFKWLTEDKNAIFYNKYNPQKRDRNKPLISFGGKPASGAIYHIHVAWREK